MEEDEERGSDGLTMPERISRIEQLAKDLGIEWDNPGDQKSCEKAPPLDPLEN